MTGLGHEPRGRPPSPTRSAALAPRRWALTSDTPNSNWGWFGTNLLPFYTYGSSGCRVCRVRRRQATASVGSTNANLSDAAHLVGQQHQGAAAKPGSQSRWRGLSCMTNQNGSLQGHGLGVATTARLHILTIVDANGNR